MDVMVLSRGLTHVFVIMDNCKGQGASGSLCYCFAQARRAHRSSVLTGAGLHSESLLANCRGALFVQSSLNNQGGDRAQLVFGFCDGKQ